MNLPEADEDAYALLHEGFPPDQIEERTQGGRAFRYVQTGSVQNRLDEVLGPCCWEEDYEVVDDVTVLCRLAIELPSGRRVTKTGVGLRKGPEAKPGDAGRTWKAGFTDALKHAASKHGVGRYLRGNGVPAFVEPALRRIAAREQVATGEYGPGVGGEVPNDPAPGPIPPARVNGPPYPDTPRTGRALFAWVKQQEQEYEVGLIRYLNGWAKLQDLPGRMVDWTPEQVEKAHAEALRKLQSVAAARHGDAYEGELAPAN